VTMSECLPLVETRRPVWSDWLARLPYSRTVYET
jgi:hypothetical protein